MRTSDDIVSITNHRTCEVRRSTITGRPIGQGPLNRRHESEKINTVIRIVCEHYGIAEDEMINSKRGPVEISWPRQVAMFMACKFTNFPVISIGRRFVRDHTTVSYSRSSVQGMTACYPAVRSEISEVNQLIAVALISVGCTITD